MKKRRDNSTSRKRTWAARLSGKRAMKAAARIDSHSDARLELALEKIATIENCLAEILKRQSAAPSSTEEHLAARNSHELTCLVSMENRAQGSVKSDNSARDSDSIAPVIEFKQQRRVVFQEDLEQVIALRRVFRQAKARMEEMETFVASMVRAGAAVEPGMYVPEMRKVFRRIRDGKSGYYFRLYISK